MTRRHHRPRGDKPAVSPLWGTAGAVVGIAFTVAFAGAIVVAVWRLALSIGGC